MTHLNIPTDLQRAGPLPRGCGSLHVGLWGALLLALLAVPARAEKVEQLKLTGYVNDFAGVLSAQAREQLTALCTEVDQKTRAQIAVVTIRSLEGDTPQDFANRLFKQWGVGYKPDDRGVLILLAVSDRKYWAEVGYGLEPILPDGKIGGFGREMVPMLRQGDYGGALLHLTSRIAEVIASGRGVTLGSRPAAQRPRREQNGRAAVVLLVFLFFFLLFWPLLWASRRGGHYRRGGWGGPWTLGGGLGSSGGGGGFGGGGFGGFGGGASGGGGAGGSW